MRWCAAASWALTCWRGMCPCARRASNFLAQNQSGFKASWSQMPRSRGVKQWVCRTWALAPWSGVHQLEVRRNFLRHRDFSVHHSEEKCFTYTCSGFVFFADSWDRIGFQEPIFLLAAESYRVPGTNKKPNPAALMTRVYKRLQRQVQRLQALRCVLEPVCGWVSILHCELVASELAEALQAAQPRTGEAGDLKVLALAYIPLISATRWISPCGVLQCVPKNGWQQLWCARADGNHKCRFHDRWWNITEFAGCSGRKAFGVERGKTEETRSD